MNFLNYIYEYFCCQNIDIYYKIFVIFIKNQLSKIISLNIIDLIGCEKDFLNTQIFYKSVCF